MPSAEVTTKSEQEQHKKWLRLYSEPDVWENPEKRAAMFQARWEYQNTVMNALAHTSQPCASREKTN
ncbi:MAG: hypothetical protein V4671_13625 [Armatimonadota bacterium]